MGPHRHHTGLSAPGAQTVELHSWYNRCSILVQGRDDLGAGLRPLSKANSAWDKPRLVALMGWATVRQSLCRFAISVDATSMPPKCADCRIERKLTGISGSSNPM